LTPGCSGSPTVARGGAGDVQRLADEIIEAVPEDRQDDIAVLALRRAG
jgi:hypothetical protein